jgi:hypothetical protein
MPCENHPEPLKTEGLTAENEFGQIPSHLSIGAEMDKYGHRLQLKANQQVSTLTH